MVVSLGNAAEVFYFNSLKRLFGFFILRANNYNVR